MLEPLLNCYLEAGCGAFEKLKAHWECVEVGETLWKKKFPTLKTEWRKW